MNIKDKLGWIVLVLLLLSPITLGLYGWLTLGKQRYTIGILIDIKGAKGGYQAVYKYEVGGNSIKVRSSSNPLLNSKEKRHKSVGKNFYVMFSEKKIGNSRILLDYPVPDSIKNAPPNGWDSIPGIGRLENPFIWSSSSPPVKKK